MHLHSYDEDDEPLISAENPYSDLDEDAMMRFTATGRPAPVFKSSPIILRWRSIFCSPTAAETVYR